MAKQKYKIVIMPKEEVRAAEDSDTLHIEIMKFAAKHGAPVEIREDGCSSTCDIGLARDERGNLHLRWPADKTVEVKGE